MGNAGKGNKKAQCFTKEKLASVCNRRDSCGPEAPQLPRRLFSFPLQPKSNIGSSKGQEAARSFPDTKIVREAAGIDPSDSLPETY